MSPGASCSEPRTTPAASLSLEVLEHGEDAPVVAFGGRQFEPLEDARDVFFDGADGDDEHVSDAGVRATLRHQCEHLELSW